MPGTNKLSPEGAPLLYFIDCTSRVLKMKAGGKVYADQAEIGAQLAAFKTFNGSPLTDILSEYGIHISALEVYPESAFHLRIKESADDIMFELSLDSPAEKPMPCHLRKWTNADPLPVVEIVRRHDAFPFVDPDVTDPLVYWAATGKCSTAYSY